METKLINNNRDCRGVTLCRYLAAVVALSLLGVGCGPGASQRPGDNSVATQQDLVTPNGLGDNGLSNTSFAAAQFDSATFDWWIKGHLEDPNSPEDLALSQQRNVVM